MAEDGTSGTTEAPKKQRAKRTKKAKANGGLNPAGLNYLGAAKGKAKRFPVSYVAVDLHKRLVKAAADRDMSLAAFVLEVLNRAAK